VRPKNGMRAIVGWVWAACLLGIGTFAHAQGITTTPRPPSRPAAQTTANPPAVKQDEPKVEEKSGTGPNTNPAEGAKAPPKKSGPPVPKIELHGGAWLFYWQPIDLAILGAPPEKPFARLHFAHLNFDGSIGDFGLFFNASVRDTKMREFYAGPAWIEEGYFYYKNPYVTVKVGKVYSRYGLLWDNSFYGNIQFYDGIKLDPNHGISAEGSVGREKGFRLGYYGQYFIVDGRTNGSFQGRDTISIPGAYRRHMVVVRAEPAYFWSKDTNLTLGVSGQYFQADLPAPVGKKDVARFAGDFYLNVGPFSAWGEVSRQVGQSVTEWPVPPVPATATTPAVPGRASARNDYLLVGGELRWKTLVGRYNLSGVVFEDLGIREIQHCPGLGYNMNEYLQFLVEYSYWTQEMPGGAVNLLDRSVSTTIHGYF